MASMNEVARRVVLIFLFGMLSPFVVSVTAFAQAGSTGGKIGKTDKSLSGGDQAPSIQPAPKARKQTGAPNNSAASSCSKMPGNWAWFNYPDVVIKPDGTASASFFSATWTCKNNFVLMHWSHGYTDRLTLSRDGTHLEGTNGGSTVVSGDRK